MTYSRKILSSDTADEQYISIGGELSLSNLGQKELLLAMAEKGAALRTTARGFSMQPFIRDKDVLTIAPVKDTQFSLGDVVAFAHPGTNRLVIHRIIGRTNNGWLIKGDNCYEPDGVVVDEKIIGRVSRVERGTTEVKLAVGKSRYFISLLSRGNVLLHFKKNSVLILQVAGNVLQRVQSLAAYRGLVRTLSFRIIISEAGDDDMEAVHKMFTPDVPYRRQEASPNVTNWVAKRNGKIIAFIQNVYNPEAHHPWKGHWLFSLYVRVRYRGMGVGKILTGKVIEKAREQNAKELLLAVFEGNRKAINLYQTFGFEYINHPDLESMLAEEKIKTGRRRIIMRKKLG